MDDAALIGLADAIGIEARYWDIEGRLRETSTATARRLLSALGHPANTAAEIAGSVNALVEERWREVLPPVVVGTEEQEIGISIRLPARRENQSARWSVELETGGTLGEDFQVSSLPLEESWAVGANTLESRRLTLPAMPTGYHRLRLEADGETVGVLVIAPKRSYLPERFRSRRYWGIAAQLYAVRSEANWGIGDFSDLGALADWAAAAGADAVGINPLHALFIDDPEHASPYSPNSRSHLNPLYIDVTAVPDFIESAEARVAVESAPIGGFIKAARAGSLVDYPNVAAAKLGVMERLHRHFLKNHAADERGSAFRKFVEDAGADLQGFVAFQVLAEHLGSHDWTHWPETFRNKNPIAVGQFVQDRRERVSFFQYLQWQTQLQLAAAAQRSAGDTWLGLCRDLAVGVYAEGADHWANQEVFVGGARIGAPPDPFNEAGQDWGVVPFNPRRLRAAGYTPFISMLRSNMRHAGALRIDHVMGWQRLFLVPAGGLPEEGAYLRFPIDDLLSIAALESQRNRCLLIGEDLGTVPAGFRERMAATGMLSYRVLSFEREHGRFRRPSELPEAATVLATTHDLATLRGYWSGDDIVAKARGGFFRSSEEEQRTWKERADDIGSLLQALSEEGLLPDLGGEERPQWTPELTLAVHRYLARSRAHLMMVQLADVANELKQANLPGTTTEFTNWRGRLERSLEELRGDVNVAQGLAAIAHERLA